MNKKLLAIACSWGALLLSSCMDTFMVESDMSGMPSQGVTYHDGTIYEYLENGGHSLGVTHDSLLYLLSCSVEKSSVPLKFQKLKTCSQGEEGKYTLMAISDSCIRLALKMLSNYQRLNNLVIDAEDIPADAPESEKYVAGELTLEKLLNYREEIEHTDAQAQKPKINIYEYRAPLDTMLCRYMTADLYDTEKLSRVTSAEGAVIQGLYSYQMNLSYRRLPANGYIGADPQDITFYDIRDTLNMTYWESIKVMWIDVQTKNGVTHVLFPQHEFGFGNFIHYFKNVDHEE